MLQSGLKLKRSLDLKDSQWSTWSSFFADVSFPAFISWRAPCCSLSRASVRRLVFAELIFAAEFSEKVSETTSCICGWEYWDPWHISRQGNNSDDSQAWAERRERTLASCFISLHFQHIYLISGFFQSIIKLLLVWTCCDASYTVTLYSSIFLRIQNIPKEYLEI